MSRRPRNKRNEPRGQADEPVAAAQPPADDSDEGSLIDENSDIPNLHCESEGGK